jgi:hypothetical protein
MSREGDRKEREILGGNCDATSEIDDGTLLDRSAREFKMRDMCFVGVSIRANEKDTRQKPINGMKVGVAH